MSDYSPGSDENVIRVRGVRVHNLRNVDVDLPRDALVVLSGVSGSGKSSLAFDTLFAEGQRRYLESLSAYTRQFLDQLERPDADLIDGLPPTICIEQRAVTAGPRSTLATTTEIYDFLRLLYARAGQAHCTECGRPVSRQTAEAVVDRILALEDRRKVMILAPLVRGRKGTHRAVFEKVSKEGFVRARVDGEIVDASDPPALAKGKPHDIEAVIDRIVVKQGIRPRLQESVELALRHGEGTCVISFEQAGTWHDRLYSEKFACPDCGVSYLELEPRTFSFNSPYGACPECDGLGVRAGQESEVRGQRSEIRGQKSEVSGQESGESVQLSLPLRRPQSPPGDVTNEQRQRNQGADAPRSPCPACGGTRLNPFARGVTVAGRTIHELTDLPVAEAVEFIDRLSQGGEDKDGPHLSAEGRRVAEKTVPEIAARLRFLIRVGLDYLSLDRPTRTLSGGELQRARLAGCLGSGLVGVCYLLDEPTVGLHPRDTRRLIETLEELRDQGTTVIVVEHDPDVLRRADWLIDLGPGAGSEGGRLVAQGPPDEVARSPESLTGEFLRRGSASAQHRGRPIDWQHALTLQGTRLHNLRDVTLRLPLSVLTCVTGVSGSGKSSLIAQTLVPAVREGLAASGEQHRVTGKGDGPTERQRDRGKERSTTTETLSVSPSLCPSVSPSSPLTGLQHLDRLVEIDQSPLGRSGRSNPATYSGLWEEIRRVFARTRDARLRGYTARRFSFNSAEGRCAECKGRGTRRIEMHFLPDLHVTCPACRGARFNPQTLTVRFGGRNAADVLRLRIDEAVAVFENFPRVRSILSTFDAVGLGYLCLGQSSQTLSGGEAQRVKLATELCRTGTGRTLFVLDEPTTGLHPADVEKLIGLLQRLVDQGHSVLVVEHHLDMIASADWLIDLGPEGGHGGGTIVAAGTPPEVARHEGSHTAAALRAYLKKSDFTVGHAASVPQSGRP